MEDPTLPVVLIAETALRGGSAAISILVAALSIATELVLGAIEKRVVPTGLTTTEDVITGAPA